MYNFPSSDSFVKSLSTRASAHDTGTDNFKIWPCIIHDFDRKRWTYISSLCSAVENCRFLKEGRDKKYPKTIPKITHPSHNFFFLSLSWLYKWLPQCVLIICVYHYFLGMKDFSPTHLRIINLTTYIRLSVITIAHLFNHAPLYNIRFHGIKILCLKYPNVYPIWTSVLYCAMLFLQLCCRLPVTIS